jgi:4-alpha-glucanotransferase
MSDKALLDLADAAGIIVDWEDAAGQPQRVGIDTIRTVLDQLGLPAASAADRADSMAQLHDEARPDFVTADLGQPLPLPILSGTARLVLEDGDARDFRLDGEVPAIDRPGYHRLDWSGGTLTIAVAPPCCHPVPAGRPWGTAVQLYSLRDDSKTAFGDFATLAGFARSAAAHGIDALAISPVHALFTADPSRYSPYSPSSRQFLNPLYADAGPTGAGDALIDWPTAGRDKLARLRALYDGLDPATRAAFATDTPSADLQGHALFEALHAHFFAERGAGGWQDWPAAYHDPAGPAVVAFAATHRAEIDFHLFLQGLAEHGLADAAQAARDGGMTIGLIADIAVGIDPGGSHGWHRRDELMMDLGIGAPPDAFQANGQDWGITGFSPTALRRTGFQPFLAMLRAAMRHAGGVRIDHALGLRRLWVVPRGASPLDGAYLRYPEQDLLRLIALESQRSATVVIGEDLGVVPPGFRDVIAARGISGMRVLPFERDADGAFTPPATWGRQAVAMTSTHDMVPIAGWWRGTDIDWRTRIDPTTDTAAQNAERAEDRTRLWDACTRSGAATGPAPAPNDPVPALDAAVVHAASAPCDLLIVPAEDLFGLDEAPNMPGTVAEHPNWRRRLPDTADALFARSAVQTRIARIAEKRHA